MIGDLDHQCRPCGLDPGRLAQRRSVDGLQGRDNPIAMAVPLEIGGLPALTGALAILGGIAAVGQQMLHRLRVSDWPAHRLAVGSGITVAQVAPGDEMGSPLRPLG